MALMVRQNRLRQVEMDTIMYIGTVDLRWWLGVRLQLLLCAKRVRRCLLLYHREWSARRWKVRKEQDGRREVEEDRIG